MEQKKHKTINNLKGIMFIGSTTFVTMHDWAHRLCPDTFVPRHVCAHTRLFPYMRVARHVCAHTRLCSDTIVPKHVCAQAH